MQIQGPWNHEKPHFPLYHPSLSSCHLGVVGRSVSGHWGTLTGWAASTHPALRVQRERGGDSTCAPNNSPALGAVTEASSDIFNQDKIYIT